MVDAQKNYKKALEKGVLKILSKVPILTPGSPTHSSHVRCP
jgi:glutamate synthase domain-containing protein 2